ncbi:transcriptional regulator [Bacillus sp. M6-12]|uniref:ArsR/SmtB family transcription factor n=1 Tax=Bacillus sp. M6-12 TaxID=2054166 RepID=UPI000C76ABDE|nr:metalloregulator ArsR/SmtB family transcription factor [Bacillus sp. M6-12]PLS17994.1 transcriptional regulator [Bacillus sp. M6-12]
MEEQDACEIICIDSEKVNRIASVLQKQNTAAAAKMFKALSDDTRIKIAYILSLEEELCVCDIANIAGVTTAAASHHLRLLKSLGLAKHKKVGKLVYYSLDDQHVKHLIQLAVAHQEEVMHRV